MHASWWGPAKQVEKIDQPDSLLFRVQGRRRLGELILTLIAGTTLSILSIFHGALYVAFIVTLLTVVSTWRAWHKTRTEIVITEFKVRASGDLGRTSGEVSLVWPEVCGLEYRYGSRTQDEGLYARLRGWSAVCLAPGVNEEQSSTMIKEIVERFPYRDMADDFGPKLLTKIPWNEVITLGISKGRRTSVTTEADGKVRASRREDNEQ